jgi:DNA-binding NarL/FixJ family response regulator
VVALVAEGLSNRDTGRELNLSEDTIKKYLFRISASWESRPGSNWCSMLSTTAIPARRNGLVA